MYIKKLSIRLLAGLLFLSCLQLTSDLVVCAAAQKDRPSPKFLCEEHLQGSMQGSSGTVLDFDGDGRQDLAVGAPYARLQDGVGAVLVYYGNDSGIMKGAGALLSGGGNLGWSLISLGDINGDGNAWLAAGAHSGSGENVSLSGTVSIFRGGGIPLKVVSLEGENAMDKFGFALTAGDLNADGIPDLIVGAPLHSPSPAFYQQGAAYIFFGPDFDPAQGLKIPAADGRGGIGSSFATGDINSDGFDDLLMEAAGKVIGFYGGPSFRLASDPEAEPDVVFNCADRGFGRSIAVLWDVDKDGYKDVAIGAYQAQLSYTDIDTGRVFIVSGGSGLRSVDLDANPAPQDLIARIDGEPNGGQFGSAILPVADIDGNGTPGLAVSAVHGDGNTWPMTGKIFLVDGSKLGVGVTLASAAVFPGESRDMHQGAFLALIEERMWLVAGAPTDKANTGSVRIFDLNGNSRAKAAKKTK